MQNNIFAFVEPSFYGVKYVEYTKKLGYKILVIVSSKENPRKYGYEEEYDYLIECDVRNKEKIYKSIKSFKYFNDIIGLLPATDYATPNTCWVAEKIGLKTMDYNAAIAARNKDIARELFTKFDVPSPKYKAVKTYDEARKFTNFIGYPVVLKPTNAASSQFVMLINDQTQLESAFNELYEFKETYMGFKVRDIYLIEEFMYGQEYSIELFLKDGESQFIEVTKKLKTKPPFFAETGHIIPAPINNKEPFIEIAEKGANALGIYDGPLHIEVMNTDEGLKIVEINGRPGGDEITSQLIPLSFGINIFQNTVFNYLNKDLKLEKKRHNYSMITYIFAHKNGSLSDINGLDEVQKLEFVHKVHINTNMGENVKTPENSDDRLGYVIFSAKSYQSLVENKKIIENLIETVVK